MSGVSSKMHPKKLRISFDLFFEAYNYHSYYHNKLYIDPNGKIKNGLNCAEDFGQIKEINIEQLSKLICSTEFMRLGKVNKTNTRVCEVCEFRYMCVDSRPIYQNGDKWYHKEECSYNPYISKWDFEENFLSLKESGIDIDLEGSVSINQKQLTDNLSMIWGV